MDQQLHSSHFFASKLKSVAGCVVFGVAQATATILCADIANVETRSSMRAGAQICIQPGTNAICPNPCQIDLSPPDKFGVLLVEELLSTQPPCQQGGITATGKAKQSTQVNVTAHTLNLISSASTETSANRTGDPLKDTFTGGSGVTGFNLSFTVPDNGDDEHPGTGASYTLTGLVSVDTAGNTDSSDSQIRLHGEDVDFNFEAEDAPGLPRSVPVNLSGKLKPGNYTLSLFSLSTIGPTQSSAKTKLNTTFSVVELPPAPRTPSDDVEVVALEVVQAIQDWKNSVPLIAGKRTFVRAHFQSTGQNVEVVTGKLRGFIVGGFEFPESPLAPVGDPYVETTADATAVRSNLASSLNFELPSSWTTSGTIELRVEPTNAIPPTIHFVCNEPAESGGTAGDCKVRVTFVPAPRPQVKFIRVSQTLPGGTTIAQPTAADVLEVIRRSKAAFPIDRFEVDMGSLTIPALPAFDISSFQSVNNQLEAKRLSDMCDSSQGCHQLYYGVLRTPSFTGGVAGLANIVQHAVASGILLDGFGYGRHVAAHELGHLFGQAHAIDAALPQPIGLVKTGYCGETASIFAPDFPFFFFIDSVQRIVPTLGPKNPQEEIIFGLDTHTMRVVDPNHNFELMGYCGPNFPWSSKYTYTNILANIQTTFPTSAAAARRVVAVQTMSDFLVVRGVVDAELDTAQLFPFGMVTSPVPPTLPPEGDYTLRLLDAGTNIVAELTFQPSFDEEYQTSLGGFLIAVPADPSIKQAVILHNDLVIAEKTASPNPPTIQVLSPNGGENISDDPLVLSWDAVDADDDPLTYVVQYSIDGGVTFDTLAMDWDEQTLPIDRESLRGSTNALFRVTASDGFNTASDESNAPFTVPNNPPHVFILTPTPAQLFSGTLQVFLEAFAFDREDGELSGTSLQWKSDIDGVLGTGNELNFQADQLSGGTHLITVTATDSGSLTQTASVPIVVFQQTTTGMHDLAVVSVKPPKKITLSEKKPNQTKPVKIQIQNLGNHDETIPDLSTLMNVVDFTVESLGDCPTPTVSVVPPKKGFPIVLRPKKKLTVLVNITFDCVNDSAANSKSDPGHEDYRYTVNVDHSALGTGADGNPSNDDCPRPPNGSDKGCGGKDPVTKQLGADLITDVIQK